MNTNQRALLALWSSVVLSRYASDQQRAAINTEFNNSKRILEKLGISAALMGASSAAVIGTMGVAVGASTLHPFLPDVYHADASKAILAIALSYAFEILATYDPKVGTTPNLIATYAYYQLQRLVPEDIKRQKIATMVSTFIPVVSGEPWTLLGSFVPVFGPTGVVTKNTISALGQLATGLAMKYYQHRTHEESNE